MKNGAPRAEGRAAQTRAGAVPETGDPDRIRLARIGARVKGLCRRQAIPIASVWTGSDDQPDYGAG